MATTVTSATNTAPGEVLVVWTSDSTTLIGFHVRYRTVAGPGAWQTACYAVEPDARQFTVRGLSAGTAYEFDVLSHEHSAAKLWSDTATWGGSLPGAGASVTIPAGEVYIFDISSSPNLLDVTVEGALVFDDTADRTLNSECIDIADGGVMRVGSSDSKFTHICNINLFGARTTHTTRSEDNALDNDGNTRCIHVQDGGTLVLFGETHATLRTKLAAHAAVSASSFTIADAVGWASGDLVAFGVTDFNRVTSTQVLTLSGATSGTAMSTTAGLTTARWGLLQYPTDNGMSLTQDNFNPAVSTCPTVLDQRATILNLTRNIRITSENDSHWSTNGFGFHIMIMGVRASAQIDGISMVRGGQRRAMGRYPIHWHMNSYTAAVAGVGGGTYLGDLQGDANYIRNSVIYQSENRAVTLHGCCGVIVDGVFAVDIKGHAFFEEDGTEERNTITNCVAMKVQDAGSTNRLKVHDNSPAGFWLTNPNNTITHNEASDCFRGLWNSFASACFGLSRNASVSPSSLVVKQFDDNIGHSCTGNGIMTLFPVTDEAGNIGDIKYDPGSTKPFRMLRNKHWKNETGGYRNRVGQARYVNWTAADNNGRDFSGASDFGSRLAGALLIGTSLNNATAQTDPERIAFASYHYHLTITDVTAINYHYSDRIVSEGEFGFSTPGQFVHGGGVFDMSDLYTLTYSGLGIYNKNWLLIDSYAGPIAPPPYFDGFDLEMPLSPGFYRYWGIAGAVWDPYGHWGPPDWYLVPDNAYFTYGLTQSQATYPTDSANGITTPDIFYGFGMPVINDTSSYLYTSPSDDEMTVTRLNTSNVSVGSHTIGDDNLSTPFHGFRHTAIAKGGRYKLTFAGNTVIPTTCLTVWITNAWRTTDQVLLCLPWEGSIPVAGRVQSFDAQGSDATLVSSGRARLMTATGSSIADVLADTTGATMWQDTANDCVWINYIGGTLNYTHADGSESIMERHMIIRLRAA